TLITVAAPGVLANDSDPSGYPLKASTSATAVVNTPFTTTGGCSVTLNANGSLTATSPAAGTCTFPYYALNSQGTASATAATVTLTFPTASNLNVKVADANTGILVSDYKWVIEQDLTYKVDPKCQVN